MPARDRVGTKQTPMKEAYQEHGNVDLRSSHVRVGPDPIGVGPVDNGDTIGVGKVEKVAQPKITVKRHRIPFRPGTCAIALDPPGAVTWFQVPMDRRQRPSRLLDQLHTSATIGEELLEPGHVQSLENDLSPGIVERDDCRHDKESRLLPHPPAALRPKPLSSTGAGLLDLDNRFVPNRYGSPSSRILWVHPWLPVDVVCGALATDPAGARSPGSQFSLVAVVDCPVPVLGSSNASSFILTEGMDHAHPAWDSCAHETGLSPTVKGPGKWCARASKVGGTTGQVTVLGRGNDTRRLCG
jgi:hypothetical protein